MKIFTLLTLFSLSLFANEKLSLQLLWKHQFEFAGFYIAKEKGYYSDVGLDVTLKEYDFGMNIVEDVLAHKSQIGVARSSIILEKLHGKKVIFLNALYQSSPYILIAKERLDLQNIEDFKNKKIMLSDDLASIAAISAMMKVKNITSKEYTTLSHSFNIDDLVHNKTDLMTAYGSNEPYELEKHHIPYRKFDPKEYGFDFYADILFTSSDYLQTHTVTIEKFQEASLKGWHYAFEHIDETIELILKKYNSQHKSADALRYEANILKKLAYQEGVAFGDINEQRVVEIANVYRLQGLTTSANSELKNSIYRAFSVVEFLKRSLNIKLFLVIVFLSFLALFLFLYKQYILKKQNENLEKLVNKKTRELQQINATLEQTVRQRTHELELALSAKSDFLANMSHEIRTPLNAIIGFVDILYKKESDAKKRSRLEIIKESSHSLLTIINDILDYSKLEKEKLSVEHTPFDLHHVFEHVVELFFNKAKEKNISVVLKIDKNLPKKTLGDSTRLKQVFSNLLSNAIKFSYKNEKVYVNVKYLESDNRLYCEIIDKGEGIAPQKIGTIFNSFEQADSSTSRVYGGTGLGLSISKKLIYLMGGDIHVISEPKVGSKFYFTIQLFESEELELEDVKEQERVQNSTLKGCVLIVEDNKTNQMLLGILLDELSLEYEIANNGVEAVEKVKERGYDIILMDENMPQMNGIEATKIIRTIPNRDDIPIVAITANALKGDRERFIKSGMNDYLSKPIDANDLQRVLYNFLDK